MCSCDVRWPVSNIYPARVHVHAPRLVNDALYLQGGPSGRGPLFVDIALKVPPSYKLLILQRNYGINLYAWTTPVSPRYAFIVL